MVNPKYKKAIRTIVNILIKSINILILFLSYLILKSNNLRLVVLREERIGHQAGNFDIEMYIAKNRFNNGIKTWFIFSTPKKLVSNNYLRKIIIESIKDNGYKYLLLNQEYLLDKILFYICSHRRLLKGNKYFYFADTDIGERVTNQLIKTSDNFYSLRESIGIENEGYICIYSRDSLYLKNRFPHKDWSYHEYRNSNIDNLKLLSEYVIDNKINSIVRVGSKTNSEIKWGKNEGYKIIDYSNSTEQSPKNDIDIICGCNLYISNGGGPESVAIASRRKMIKINQIPLGDEQLYHFGLWIPKIHIWKSNGLYLSLEEICNLKLHLAYRNKDYINSNVIPLENTPEEILEIFKDYLKYKNNNFTDNDNELINKYQIKRSKISNKYGILKDNFNFIAPSFLRKYKRLLD
tara:strand:+ start:428 stop:1648 length:1221 start_codon:yes stop_codon:yes gene_type:complete